MTNDEKYMAEAIAYANQTNQIWPFAALLVDENQNILVKATDCAHISPLFHAESLLIHVFATNFDRQAYQALTVYTTAEPDTLSQSALYWACVTGIPIKRVVYGAGLQLVNKLWKFGIDISARAMQEKSVGFEIELVGPIMEDRCMSAFEEAKKRQIAIGKPNPGREVLSKNVADYYCIERPV